MSVIGRLDEQVDAVLITPVSRKRPAPEPPAKPRAENSNTPVDEESSIREKTEYDRELPVWML